MKISSIPNYSQNSFKGKIKIGPNKFIDSNSVRCVTTDNKGDVFINYYGGLLGGTLKTYEVSREYKPEEVKAAVEKAKQSEATVDLSPTETTVSISSDYDVSDWIYMANRFD